MKKLWYILWILSAACLFTACSDDDTTLKHDGPVVDYVLPPFLKLGAEVVIPGNGFSSRAELYLKSETEELTRIVPEQIAGRGILFQVPETLAKGYYTVVLRQEGDWELGSVRVIEDYLQVKRLKTISWDMGGFILPFTLVYDESGRLIRFYDEFLGDFSLTYGENSIEVTNAFEGSSFSYALQDGQVVSSEEYGMSAGWTYQNGYVTNAAGNNYTYENGNLITTDYNDMMLAPFEYADASLINAGPADITACCMYLNYAMPGVEFIASLLNINGERSVNLPTAISGLGDFSYRYENNDPSGSVTQLILSNPDYDVLNVTFVYETAEIFL